MSTALSKSTVTEIITLHEQLGGMVKVTVELVWKLGEKLTAVKAALDFGLFGAWVEENLPFSHNLANRYMRVYQRFPAGLPEDMDLSQAYLESGVKRLAAPEPPPPISKDHPLFRWDGEAAVKGVLRMPVVSSAHLKRYRIAVVQGEIRLVRPGWHEPMIYGALFLPPNEAELQDAFEELQVTMQAALELYLEKRELLEDNGVIAGYQDPSPIAEVERVAKRRKDKKTPAAKEDL